MRRRAAITGIGVICPLGATADETWSSAMAGVSAIRAHSYVNLATGTELTIPAASVPDRLLKAIPGSIAIIADKFARLAVMAATDAVASARIDLAAYDRARVGVSTGSCMNGIMETEVGFAQLFVKKRPKVHPFTLVRTMPNAPAAYVSGAFDLSGPALHYSTTCSSSSVAIGEAARLIRHDYADVMIAGGTEALLTYAAVNCWHSASLLAALHEEPSRSCRPFDATRDGTVLGEGAAFVVVEERESAVRRGARILAEVAGYGCTADSRHVTQPSSPGQASAMRVALADSGFAPSEVGYVHAHGTGTKLNDAVETEAVKLALGSHASRIPISSSKSMVGHMIGAAGAFGVIMCVKALEHEQVPPTANLYARDPACDLDYVPNAGRPAPGLNVAMVNAFGFGGTCASLILTNR